MRLLRAVTRRGFSVGTAGWFTVLKPNTWFPASRLPRSLHYRGSQSPDAAAVDHAISPRIMIPSTRDRRLLHTSLVVLSAIAITSVLLWWIMHP
jgi:hypothetical protein